MRENARTSVVRGTTVSRFRTESSGGPSISLQEAMTNRPQQTPQGAIRSFPPVRSLSPRGLTRASVTSISPSSSVSAASGRLFESTLRRGPAPQDRRAGTGQRSIDRTECSDLQDARPRAEAGLPRSPPRARTSGARRGDPDSASRPLPPRLDAATDAPTPVSLRDVLVPATRRAPVPLSSTRPDIHRPREKLCSRRELRYSSGDEVGASAAAVRASLVPGGLRTSTPQSRRIADAQNES